MLALINFSALVNLLLTTSCLLVMPAQPMGLLGSNNKRYGLGKPAGPEHLQPPTTADSGHDINQLSNNVVKFLPDGISQSDKLRAFLECRRECIAKCDRLVYIYSDKKEFCHDCIRQCMLSFLQQARSLGIEFNSPPATRDQSMLGDAPAVDSADSKKRRRGRDGGGKRRRNRRKQRRERRLKERRQRQALLKNCIVHK